MYLAIGFFLVAWLCLTVSLILQHITDRDGWSAVLWALAPTVIVLALSYYSQTENSRVGQGVQALALTCGLFLMCAMTFLKSLRRFRNARRQT